MKYLKMLCLVVPAFLSSVNVANAVLHAANVYIQGSACVGIDCVNNASFGFDTIRLEENNLRIKFNDTSTAASFPRNDWQLTANDSANGGAEKFSIDDISGGRTPFTIEAGAPSHSLFVDDGGRLGLGTNVPVVDIHVKSGNTPTLRLEQDSTSGFTPQTWDVAGNEAGFFIRDASSGSTLPFRIQPGAPSSAIHVVAGGNVGIGDSTPDADLDVAGAVVVDNGDGNNVIGVNDDLHIFDDGSARLALENTTAAENATSHQKWTFNSNGTLRISGSTDAAELVLDGTGAMTILGAITTGGGTCGGGCDVVFEPDYKLPSIEEHSNLMFENKYLPNVGPTKENAPINLSDKLGRMLNELETAHIYIVELHQRIEILEAAIKN